ncbi:hypothetical protein CC1G_09872 [Coprinopsis cinerea okayama7|uniref:F-box domain-containing protein n=1 Tax=Coprinopsis cinerea (strain Okayama-7 / 130 / ATCC MYA-4618 / FGSC 9003) TaxID=240176 RepID=A8N8L3_COPC7|nr:hypothetical protein CC1G_09872 [Coprinopsis cinerea okayama7\|eukprot:XP_001831169.2 hypothetical protein CC1G_09872 [Coprinopsis cinerea okayama7\
MSLSLNSETQLASHCLQLPPELLWKIFEQYQRDLIFEDGSSYYSSWMVVTHVCRTWREAAINCPGLWRYIVDGSPTDLPWITVHLNRIHPSTTLHVEWIREYTPSLPSPLVELVPANLHRIRELELVAVSSPDDPKLQVLSSGHAPLLHLLLISCYQGCTLPLDLLDNGTPRLQTLALHNCLPFPTSKLFENLTVFHLLCDATNTDFNIQDYFEKMPKLVDFRIDGAKVHRNSNGDVTVLPSLKVLEFEGDWRSCQALLDSVAIHRSSRVNLVLTAPVPHLSTLPSLSPRWISPPSPHHLPSFAQGGLQSLSFEPTKDMLRTQMWHEVVHFGGERIDIPTPSLSFGVGVLAGWCTPDLAEPSRFLCSQPLGDVRSMKLDWLWGVTSQAVEPLEGVLNNLSALQELTDNCDPGSELGTR